MLLHKQMWFKLYSPVPCWSVICQYTDQNGKIKMKLKKNLCMWFGLPYCASIFWMWQIVLWIVPHNIYYNLWDAPTSVSLPVQLLVDSFCGYGSCILTGSVVNCVASHHHIALTKCSQVTPSLANLSPSFSALTSFSTSFSVVLFQIPHHIFSFLSVCPIHFHFLILIFTIISSSPIMPHFLFLEVISCHLKNLQKHWFINVCNLWARKMIIL